MVTFIFCSAQGEWRVVVRRGLTSISENCVTKDRKEEIIFNRLGDLTFISNAENVPR